MLTEDAGTQVKEIVEALFAPVAEAPHPTHVASLQRGGEVPGDWRERFLPLTRMQSLGGAGKSRIRRWVWSHRTEPWFGEPGTLVWMRHTPEGVKAGFGRIT